VRGDHADAVGGDPGIVECERDRTFKRLALDSVIVRTDQSVSAPIRNLFAKRARRRR